MIPVRLVLADDHEIMRVGLRSLLEAQINWSVVGEAIDGEEAVEMVLSLKPRTGGGAPDFVASASDEDIIAVGARFKTSDRRCVGFGRQGVCAEE